MSTMQERADPLDASEATVLAGMLLADDPTSVPADAFDHPGRRALVGHWQRVGRIALGAADIEAAIAAAKVDPAAVDEAVADADAMASRAAWPAMLREAQAELIRRKRLRHARESLDRVQRDHERGNLPTAAVAAAWQRLADAERGAQANGVEPFANVLQRVLNGLPETHARRWLGLRLPTFPMLDWHLCGLRGLMLLGAGPGVGKTQLTIQLGIDVLSDPAVGLVYLTLEMSKDELATRMLSIATTLRYRLLRLGVDPVHQPEYEPNEAGLVLDPNMMKLLSKGTEQLRSIQSRIAMYGSEDIGGFSAADGDPSRWYRPLKILVEDAKRRMGVTRALVVIDNLQAIGIEPPNGKPWSSDMDRDRIVIEGLTRLQHDLDDAVLVVSEVTKTNFKNAGEMSAILGTGRTPYRADAVMLLRQTEDDGPEAEYDIDLIIDKGRDGMTRGTVHMTWDHHHTRIDELEDE